MALRVCTSTCFASLLLCAFAIAAALAETCPSGISPETTQRIFDRLSKVQIADDYRIEGVGTDKTELVVLSVRHNTPCPVIRVGFDCPPGTTEPTLRPRIPAELLQECPGLRPLVDELGRAVAGEQPAGQPPAARSSWLPWIGLAFVLLTALRLVQLRRASGPAALQATDLAAFVFSVTAAATFLLPPQLLVAVLAASWVAFTLLLLDRDGIYPSDWRHRVDLLSLFSFGLLLRFALPSWGPGDLHLNLDAIWAPHSDFPWGASPIALFRLLNVLLPEVHDTQIIWTNLILSSLVPLLLYRVVAGLGISRRPALVAGFVTAAHPLLIVFSGVLERQPTYLFAATGSILGLVSFLNRGHWRCFAAFVLGTVLATTARPEGAHVVLVHLAIMLALPAAWSARRVVGSALAVLTPMALVYVRYRLSYQPQGAMHTYIDQAPILWTVLFSRDFTPLAWIAAWIAGLLLGWRHRAAWVALWSLLALHIAWQATGTYHMFVGIDRQVASARYETILVVPFAIGIALLIDAWLAWGPGRRMSFVGSVLALAATAATFHAPYETLLTPFTIDYEYHFLRKQALTLAAGSRVSIFDSPTDADGLYDAHLVGRFVGSTVRFENWRMRNCAEVNGDLSQSYLYIGSSCAEQLGNVVVPLPPEDYARWLHDCQAMHSCLDADVVEEVDVPAHKMAWHDFKDRSVHLGLYRLTDPAICDLGPTFQQP